jgi:hypothetical protein
VRFSVRPCASEGLNLNECMFLLIWSDEYLTIALRIATLSSL